MKTGIKLVRVRPDEIDVTHPLYALSRKIEELNHENMDRVYTFFEDMLLPENFYASVTRDEFGWWIDLYKPIYI